MLELFENCLVALWTPCVLSGDYKGLSSALWGMSIPLMFLGLSVELYEDVIFLMELSTELVEVTPAISEAEQTLETWQPLVQH